MSYMIYTSGSTGLPKGVVLEHLNSQHLISVATQVDNTAPRLTTMFSFALVFDGHVRTTYPTLLLSAKLVTYPKLQLYSDFNALIVRHRVNMLNLTPSSLSALNPVSLESSGALHLGGEVVTKSLRLVWSATSMHAYNGYGPTEASVHVTFTRLSTMSFLDSERIGSIQKNVTSACSLSGPGELSVQGPQVARQYLRRPVESARKFDQL